MNSPYMGRFAVSQTQHQYHDGLDLYGIDSREIHATTAGTVVYAAWENVDDHSQGFGQFVCIKGDTDGLYYYFGHLSQILVNVNDHVNICDTIGVEGDTGHSFGSHCHYCIRRQFGYGNELSTPLLSGIPNAVGEYDDGYRPPVIQPEQVSESTLLDKIKQGTCTIIIDGEEYNVFVTKKS